MITQQKRQRQRRRAIQGIAFCVVVVAAGLAVSSQYYSYQDLSTTRTTSSASTTSSSSSSSVITDVSTSTIVRYVRDRDAFERLSTATKEAYMATPQYWNEWVAHGIQVRNSNHQRRRSQNANTTTALPQHNDSYYYDEFYHLPALHQQWISGANANNVPIPVDRWDMMDNVTCLLPPNNNNNNNSNSHHQHPQHQQPPSFTRMTWQDQPAPHAIIIGTQKGGSTAMASFLARHPRVASFRRELHFLSKTMDKMGTVSENGGGGDNVDGGGDNVDGGGIDQLANQQWYMKELLNALHSKTAQHKMEYNEYKRKKKQQQTNKSHHTNKNNHDDDSATTVMVDDDNDDDDAMKLYGPLLMVEKTPSYIVNSDRVPQRLLCLCPWAKLVLLLRNPIDRAYSQYNMNRRGGFRHRVSRMPPTFDQWIEQDYQVLVQLGVLPKGAGGELEFQKGQQQQQQQHQRPEKMVGGYRGTPQERRGWKAYTRLGTAGTVGPIGRGLYSLQIAQWMEVYQQHGRDLLGDDLLVLSSDFSKDHPEEALGRVCDHLGLPRVSLSNSTTLSSKPGNAGTYDGTVPPMSNTTRDRLQRIFEPYNRQLVDLLGEEWRDIWI